MYCRAKHNNQEKTTHSLKEGVTKFQSCKLVHGQYFCDNFILHCDEIRFTSMGIMGINVVRPPWESANSSQNCHSCSFCSHKQVLDSPVGGGGYSHTLPIRVCAAQRGRDFEAPDLEWGIHFRGVF